PGGGILAQGFLRLRCGECGHDKLLAFSCKRRGFCPSCGARRMSQPAAHVVDNIIPHVRGDSGCCRCSSTAFAVWSPRMLTAILATLLFILVVVLSLIIWS